MVWRVYKKTRGEQKKTRTAPSSLPKLTRGKLWDLEKELQGWEGEGGAKKRKMRERGAKWRTCRDHGRIRKNKKDY